MVSNDLPVRFFIHVPTDQDDTWRELNRQVGGREDWPPIIIKGVYVVGVMYGICRSVETIIGSPNLSPVMYLSAYGICASAVELLGRCLTGDDSIGSHSRANLSRGYTWLIDHNNVIVDENAVVVRTTSREYTIEDLIALRNFAAHGQAMAMSMPWDLDHELLAPFPRLFGDGMEHYWFQLQNSEEVCRNLARTRLIAIQGGPILHMWRFFGPMKQSAGGPFYQFNWRITTGPRLLNLGNL
jgi:hypothetical protein